MYKKQNISFVDLRWAMYATHVVRAESAMSDDRGFLNSDA